MKQFFKMFFASLLAMVIAGLIVFVIVIGSVVSLVSKATTDAGTTTTVSPESVLCIRLDKTFHEQGENNSLAAFSDESGFSAGLYDAVLALEAAKKDDKILGILLELGETPNNWATLQQLRTAIVDFRSSGKFIYAYGEQIPQRAYYLASAADSVFLNPVGAAEINGLATNMAFFKGTLDKLEIQPEIFYAGKFKSATEPFRAEKASEPNKQQIAAIQNGLWTEFVAAVSEHTGADAAAIRRMTDSGAIRFPSDALAYKLVDGLLYRDQVEQMIRAKTGQKETEKIRYVKLDEYAQRHRKITDKTRIAVLFAEGDITDGKKKSDYGVASEDFVKTIRSIRNNDKIKAVVMRVNSPGGSALASEVILRELQLLKEKKPLIVSMGDLAASGGYYIACQADSIFAMPTTITGSIGVFAMMFNIEKLMKNKLGVTFDEVKNAPYADFPSATRPLTPSEATRLQGHVDTIYAIFKRRVSAGRNMPEDKVDSLAQGRVWSGTDALANGLVDGLGNLDRAIRSAAAKAAISDYQVVTYPERVDKLESLMRRFSSGNISSELVRESLKQEFDTEYEWYRQIRDLKTMNGRIMMAMPFRVQIR